MTEAAHIPPAGEQYMATIRPFRAERPPKDKAAEVSAVPYDVVNTEEARQLAADNPLSFLHVSRPEIDLPDGTDIYSDAVYAKARENYDRLRRAAPLEVADGHHRAASASRASATLREQNPNHTGDEEYNYFLTVLFPADQVQILPYNRVVKDLNGQSKAKFLDALSKLFELSEEGPE